VIARIDRALAVVMWVAAAVVVVALLAGPQLIGARKQTSAAAAPKNAPSGKAVFASAGCGRCHTLAAAGASGQVGPNLDELKPNAKFVETTIKNGKSDGNGQMPAGIYSGQDAKDVAAYVAKAVGADTSG
jgi:mono/diheme cytochrome c family protein